jgi:hypothetical protein
MAFPSGSVHRWASRATLLSAASAAVLLAGGALPARAADPAPLRTVTDATPNFSGVWVDTTNNEIGVGDSKLNEIRIFPRLF